MASWNYECSKCSMIGTKEKAVELFIRTHLSIERVPWRCSLCDFKALSRQQLHNHDRHYRHIKAEKMYTQEVIEYIKSKNPYEVKVGTDIVLFVESAPLYRFDYNHVSSGTNESAIVWTQEKQWMEGMQQKNT